MILNDFMIPNVCLSLPPCFSIRICDIDVCMCKVCDPSTSTLAGQPLETECLPSPVSPDWQCVHNSAYKSCFNAQCSETMYCLHRQHEVVRKKKSNSLALGEMAVSKIESVNYTRQVAPYWSLRSSSFVFWYTQLGLCSWNEGGENSLLADAKPHKS